jgi:superfamily II DNA or RNA helicase
MPNNFITNNRDQKNLKARINTLISISTELKFLVGFFYFSGWQEVFEALKNNPESRVKLLVGLQVDKFLFKTIEFGDDPPGFSQDDHFNAFMTSMHNALNNDEMDTEAFFNQVTFFVEMIEAGRLEIRKTAEPNHAKLYIFKFNEPQAQIQDREGQFITGSSNLTRAGLIGQQEFNVEIKDYGFEDATQYFDDLWKEGIKITEEPERKIKVIDFVKHKTQAATVTPFEAYALILKTYLDLMESKKIKPHIERILEEKGFKRFSYQLDAVTQAQTILEQYNGVIIADVVGLGKSVIAALIAKSLGKRGLIICPPGLIGDKNLSTGWHGYVNDFRLYDWDVQSRGSLETMADYIHGKEYEVVIVDEAHYFRNQDTSSYEALMNICRGKKVILLSATPFNNSPADIFALLKLFVVPGKSGISLEDNLEGLFRALNYRFQKLSNIIKNANSKDPKKIKKAEEDYTQTLGKPLPINLKIVKENTKELAGIIKTTISPVLIRRNRLDLKEDFQYKTEVTELSEMEDPRELFYFLNSRQSKFYDRIISEYFAEDGIFKGAIYQPFSYESEIKDEEKLDQEGNRAFNQQKNLFDFMRRLVVKRFESSSGAFLKTIERFIKVNGLVLDFIRNSRGKYILDRKLLENIYDASEEEIDIALEQFEAELIKTKTPKNNRIYDVNTFKRKEEFIIDIQNDKKLFEKILNEAIELKLVENDPKRKDVAEWLKRSLDGDKTKMKTIIFSEYVDTVLHLEPYFKAIFGGRVLVCDGNISKDLAFELDSNFNAQFKGKKEDKYDVLITSDKLSEGFNLNRAGCIVNYDIPWNPTRVIQRLGRINRIGNKVYDRLFIYNFFPSEQGADIVKSREIASQKMFLIHHALGEDSKVFDNEEEPNASNLYKKINSLSEDDEGLSTSTFVRNEFENIKSLYPEVIEKIGNLPYRVKSAKVSKDKEINVLRKKGLSLFSQQIDVSDKDLTVNSQSFEQLLPKVKCLIDEPLQPLSHNFWSYYEKIKAFKPSFKAGRNEIALESKALNNLKYTIKNLEVSQEELIEFVKILIKDLKNFYTLSKWTVRRLANVDLSESKNREENFKDFIREVSLIRNQIGHNYLDEILKNVENQNLEMIIAVENV